MARITSVAGVAAMVLTVSGVAVALNLSQSDAGPTAQTLVPRFTQQGTPPPAPGEVPGAMPSLQPVPPTPTVDLPPMVAAPPPRRTAPRQPVVRRPVTPRQTRPDPRGVDERRQALRNDLRRQAIALCRSWGFSERRCNTAPR